MGVLDCTAVSTNTYVYNANLTLATETVTIEEGASSLLTVAGASSPQAKPTVAGASSPQAKTKSRGAQPLYTTNPRIPL